MWGLSAHANVAEAPNRTLEDFSVEELINYFAEKYQVSATQMTNTIFCESSFNPNAVGDGGHSFGVSQIYLPAWVGTITKEQALDPIFAVEFMAEKFSQGKQELWTCARNLGYNK